MEKKQKKKQKTTAYLNNESGSYLCKIVTSFELDNICFFMKSFVLWPEENIDFFAPKRRYLNEVLLAVSERVEYIFYKLVEDVFCSFAGILLVEIFYFFLFRLSRFKAIFRYSACASLSALIFYFQCSTQQPNTFRAVCFGP